MAKDKLHIIGAGGHAGMVIDTALTLGFDNIIIHDDLSKVINAGRAYKVDGTIEEFIKNCLPNTQVFIGIGENHMRAKLFYALKKKSWNNST